MINLDIVVKYINDSLKNDIKTYSELLDEFSKKHNCDITDELQKNNYTVITVNNKKKIVLKDELNVPEEKEEKMDYEKLLNFNSDSVFSVRIDSEINKKFQKFCKKNKKITKNKLVSLALYEFLSKYN